MVPCNTRALFGKPENPIFCPKCGIPHSNPAVIGRKSGLSEMIDDDFCRVTVATGWRITPLWRKGGTENAGKNLSQKSFKKNLPAYVRNPVNGATEFPCCECFAAF